MKVSVKTKDGKDPSEKHPVYVNMNGNLKTIKSSLGVTMNEGRTKNYLDDFNQKVVITLKNGKEKIFENVDSVDVFLISKK